MKKNERNYKLCKKTKNSNLGVCPCCVGCSWGILVPSITFKQNDFSVAQPPDFINIAKLILKGREKYALGLFT